MSLTINNYILFSEGDIGNKCVHCYLLPVTGSPFMAQPVVNNVSFLIIYCVRLCLYICIYFWIVKMNNFWQSVRSSGLGTWSEGENKVNSPPSVSTWWNLNPWPWGHEVESPHLPLVGDNKSNSHSSMGRWSGVGHKPNMEHRIGVTSYASRHTTWHELFSSNSSSNF